MKTKKKDEGEEAKEVGDKNKILRSKNNRTSRRRRPPNYWNSWSICASHGENVYSSKKKQKITKKKKKNKVDY